MLHLPGLHSPSPTLYIPPVSVVYYVEMLGFNRFGHARDRIRRLLAVAGVALLLGFQAFSTITIIHEADHKCSCEDCPVCHELQQCVAYFQITGSGLEPNPAPLVEPVVFRDVVPCATVEPAHPTLVSLKVRLNE